MADAGRHRRRSGSRDQGDGDHRAPRIAGRLRTCVVVARRRAVLRRAGRTQRWRRAAIVSFAIGAGIASLFYSSFLTHPRGILEPLRAAATYFERGVDPAGHEHPWHYYLGLLGWSSSGGLVWTEAFVLVLAAAGVVTSWTPLDRSSLGTVFWRRYLTGTAALTLAIFSAIPYKTPWNLLPFYAVTIVAAGIGVLGARAVDNLPCGSRRCWLACSPSAALTWDGRRGGRRSSTPRIRAILYVYAQTVPDAVRMAARIRDLAALHGEGERMLVTVIAPPDQQWPLPWYLRTMARVGYWTDARDGPT